MKTVLDIIGEYSALNDAKIRWGGKLPKGAHDRWKELKSFYDLVMAEGVREAEWSHLTQPMRGHLTGSDIRRRIPRRRRLRVPVDFDVLIQSGQKFYTVRLHNISRGGVFLSSSVTLPSEGELTLIVSTPKKKDTELLEAQAEIVWSAPDGFGTESHLRGLGIRFSDADRRFEERMDRVVVECLETNLSNIEAGFLSPDSLLDSKFEL